VGEADGASGLRLANVSARAGGLTDISLEVTAGSLLALIGPARAGKSALIGLLSGRLRRYTGDVTFAGVSLRRVAMHRRGFGLVQQDDALFAHLSLAENVAYPLRLRGVARRDRKRLVQGALDSVQLEDSGRRPHQASAAERQRASIARATVFGPRVLLLDEPLSDQPAEARPGLLACLRRLHRMLGTTTVLATRSAGDAMALADRAAVLNFGRLEQMATPATIYDAPASVAAALATGEINLLPGRVNAIDEDGVASIGLECGPAVEAQAAPGLRPRDRCAFTLRPERVAVAPIRAADMGGDALDATLIEVLHLGEQICLRLLIGTGAELVVKRPAAAGTRGLTVGSTVAIAWQPSHARAFQVK
jgi:putative spermidine/putrescine transport system ATP-binding protein